jgi:hypothetical protein
MTTYTWIKLYIEILDDPKVGLMPDWCFRRFIQFLLVAREHNQNGLLGPVTQLAWRLRSSEDDVLSALRTMSEIGIVAETPDGWLVVNFAKRQARIDGAERTRLYRERLRGGDEDVTKRHKKSDDGVSHSSISSSPSDSDSLEGEGTGEGELSPQDAYNLDLFASRFGPFNSRKELERWLALVLKHGRPKALEVLEWAQKREIDRTNRATLLDSLETAAEKWSGNGNKPPAKVEEYRSL